MYRKRRFMMLLVSTLIALISLASGMIAERDQQRAAVQSANTSVAGVVGPQASTELASNVLEKLEVKGRAPKTGYKRVEFGDGWRNINGCDVRNKILARDMTTIVTKSPTDCTVVSGMLDDPYTAKQVSFVRGADTSDDVQIDHVVALSDAWQKGAQALSKTERENLANDALNLLAVDGPTNMEKSDSDAASWLPPNKLYRCKYVARQIAVKQRYHLWMTSAEKDAIKRVLQTCPEQRLPIAG